MLKKQVVRLANAGMGIVLLGTNGEGEHIYIKRVGLVAQATMQLRTYQTLSDRPR